ncbi:hypothetical protein D9M70_506650 [compost metagenome]
MVEVDVKHRNLAGAVIAQALGGTGGIVDEGIAAIKIDRRMVTGRTAEREGGAVARMDVVGSRDGAVHRRPCSCIGAFGDHRFRREGIVAERTVDIFRRVLAHASGRETGRDRFAAIAVGDPARPGGFEELEIIGRVQLKGDLETMALRGCDIMKARLFHRRENPFGTERRLEGRYEFAAEELGLGVAELVVFGVKNAHEENPDQVQRAGRGQPNPRFRLLAITVAAPHPACRPPSPRLRGEGTLRHLLARKLHSQHFLGDRCGS